MGGWGGRLELGRVTDGNRRVDGVGGLGWAGGPEWVAFDVLLGGWGGRLGVCG